MAYYTKFKALWDENPKCTCCAIKEFVMAREKEKVHELFIRLNENFKIIRCKISNLFVQVCRS
jgi:hypothetical protein